MSTVAQRGILRWKEWVPLVTQQQRLRNLIQVIAYNVHTETEEGKNGRILYYYTLHLSTVSSPLYTSEKLESENPKWAEIDIAPPNGAASGWNKTVEHVVIGFEFFTSDTDSFTTLQYVGVVIRLWADTGGEADKVLSVWGVYFSGLVYIGPRLLSADPAALGPNSLVFHMHGGYFTAPHCFKDAAPVVPRSLSKPIKSTAVKPSYSVKLLQRLQFLQQTIKKETSVTNSLREQISSGCFKDDQDHLRLGRGSTAFRRLLSKPETPKPHPQQMLAVKRRIEQVKFRLQLLTEEKEREKNAVQLISRKRDALREENLEKGSKLQEKQQILQKDVEKIVELRRQLMEIRSHLRHKNALLDFRQKKLISELSFIYPIKELPDGRFTIRDVHLPNSEDFDGKDELMVSVALGFVAHLVQMMAYFLNIPTRYPILHFGSRSKIVDHILDTIPEKEREFPLYSRGKEKLPFDYGVFLLNKNIAQLRWSCGLTTTDLRPTLYNLVALMTLNTKQKEEWSCMRRDERNPPLSYSLDRGLDSVAGTSADLVGSDPQEYVQTRRGRCDTEPAPGASSMVTLDFTCEPSKDSGVAYETPAVSLSPDPTLESPSVHGPESASVSCERLFSREESPI